MVTQGFKEVSRRALGKLQYLGWIYSYPCARIYIEHVLMI